MKIEIEIKNHVKSNLKKLIKIFLCILKKIKILSLYLRVAVSNRCFENTKFFFCIRERYYDTKIGSFPSFQSLIKVSSNY